MRVASYLIAVAILVIACHEPARTTEPKPVAPPPPVVAIRPVEPVQKLDLDSAEILAREDVAPEVLVQHILIAWKDLEPAYRGHMDPRATVRTQADAAKLTESIAAQLRADPAALPALIEQYSEDPGGKTGEPYDVKTDTAFVPQFKKLSLRLAEHEVGIVQTTFGYHVIVRVTPPPPDPLVSANILARPARPGPVLVQHILIGWAKLAQARDPRAQARTKADADKLAVEILAQVRDGADMASLMTAYSEDPSTNTTAKILEVTETTAMVDAFKQLALRLDLGEAGLVATAFGWHIVKRVPPPPPDKLESAAILKRAPTTEKAKVKHILLGWKQVHASDERGVERSRAALEKLVKETLGKLAKGAAFESLMAQLSEDPGSAPTGISYDVTPDAPLVAPFKNLSLRLKLNEVGVVKSDFGIHIIKRVE
jgi:parvulin-like peptidyl-prolyl isomerase